MSDYNTGNPVPSIDPRDLDDNATVFDQLMMLSVPSVPDRLNVPRKTWWQVEQDAAALVSPNVSALAAAVSAANKLFYFTGSGTGAVADFPPQARTFLTATTTQAQRTALGIPWAGATTSTAVTNLDTIADTSVLGITGATTNVPAGVLSGSMVSTAVFSSTSMTQIIESRSTDRILFRRMVSGAWQPWVEMAIISTAGVNSNITSLTGLTTALSVAQGGTGVTASTGTGAGVHAVSPALTGTPTAPTAAIGTNTTQLATMAALQARILGTVSQAAGVPTGAVIETGGTLSGTGVYTKYADGTMIIVKILAIPTGCVTAAGSIFRSAATAAGSFPVNFINPPNISLMGSDSGGGGWPAMDVFGNASTWGTYSTRNHVSSGTSCAVHLTAIGRWF